MSQDMIELKRLAQESNEAIVILRSEHEKGMSGNKEAMAKAEAKLDEIESKNQEITIALEAERVARAKFEDEFKEVEKRLMRVKHSDKKEQSEEYKACLHFIAMGQKGMSPEQLKMLRTDSDPDGGVFAVPEISMEVLKNVTEISPMRALARVMQTNRKSVVLFKRTSNLTGGWRGERESAPNTSSQYGEIEIPVNKIMAEIISTREMLEDGIINVANEIMTDASEDFAQQEGFAFVLGDGVKKPKGFLYDAGVQAINSGIAADITADNVIDLAAELKTGYNATYVLNRKTIAYLRKLKTLDDQYLWQAGLVGGAPNTLNGLPYVEVPDMDNVGANKRPLACGDFMRGYRIADHVAMSVIRDDLTLASDDKIKWVFRRRTGGQVVLPEAIKVLKAAV